jgi:conjugative transfer signal peptidase TraF
MATATAASAFAAAFVAIAVADPFPRVIWNASASAPIGLYRIHPDRDPAIGVLVAVTPPAAFPLAFGARLSAEGVPLLKHVAAKAGQRVCRIGAVVSVDGQSVASARARRPGRPLPVWRGCRTLQPGELLLLNPSVPDSLDGRYFGPLPASAVIGRATPLHLRAPSQSPSTPKPRRLAMPTNIFEPTANGYAGRARYSVSTSRSCWSRSIRATPRTRPITASTSTTRTARKSAAHGNGSANARAITSRWRSTARSSGRRSGRFCSAPTTMAGRSGCRGSAPGRATTGADRWLFRSSSLCSRKSRIPPSRSVAG